MATSGTTIYELTRNQIIEAALRKIGALAVGQTPSAEAYTNGQIALNSWIANLQGLGMTVWKQVTIPITPVLNTTNNEIGVGKTTNSPFPIKVNHVYLRETASGTNTPIRMIGKEEFENLNSSTTGKPTQCYYLPVINYGILQIWPKPDADTVANYTIRVSGHDAFEGFTSASETADFPQEWQLPLIYGLAALLAPEYGTPLNDRKMLQDELTMYLDLATRSPSSEESVFFQIDVTPR